MLSFLRRRPAARCALSLSVTSTACSARSLYLLSLTGMLRCNVTSGGSGSTVAGVAAMAPLLTALQRHRTGAAAAMVTSLLVPACIG